MTEEKSKIIVNINQRKSSDRRVPVKARRSQTPKNKCSNISVTGLILPQKAGVQSRP